MVGEIIWHLMADFGITASGYCFSSVTCALVNKKGKMHINGNPKKR